MDIFNIRAAAAKHHIDERTLARALRVGVDKIRTRDVRERARLAAAELTASSNRRREERRAV